MGFCAFYQHTQTSIYCVFVVVGYGLLYAYMCVRLCAYTQSHSVLISINFVFHVVINVLYIDDVLFYVCLFGSCFLFDAAPYARYIWLFASTTIKICRPNASIVITTMLFLRWILLCIETRVTVSESKFSLFNKFNSKNPIEKFNRITFTVAICKINPRSFVGKFLKCEHLCSEGSAGQAYAYKV